MDKKIFSLFIIFILTIITLSPIVTSSSQNILIYKENTKNNNITETLYQQKKNRDDWYNSNWIYRKQLNISNPKNNYPIELNISYDTTLEGGEDVSCEEHCKNDFSDLRFTREDGTTLRDYYLKNKEDGEYALMLINTSNDNYMYMYYGNNDTSSASNPEGVYLFYDDFEDGVINTTKWEHGTEGSGGNVEEANGTINISTTYGQHGGAWIRSKSSHRTFTNNISIEKYAYYEDDDYKWFSLGTYDSVICDGTGDTTPPYNYPSFLRLNNSYSWLHMHSGYHSIAKVTNSITINLVLEGWGFFDYEWNNITYNYLYNGSLEWKDEGIHTISVPTDTSYRDDEKDIFISQGGYDSTRAGWIAIEYIRIRRYCPGDEPYWTSFGNEEEYNNPPNIPDDPFPENQSMGVDINVDLSWTGGDPDGDIVTYDVYFGNITPPPIVVNNQSSTTYDPGTLDYDKLYYWQIISWDEHGKYTKGPIWWFNTGDNFPPSKPIITDAPTYGTTDIPLEFSARTTDPESHNVYYMWNWGDGTYSDWVGPFESGNPAEASHSWDETGEFNVTVKAKDIFDAESSWSDSISFTIENKPPNLQIKKPESKALYFFNAFIFRFFETLIIGPIDIIAEANDAISGMNRVEIYIDNNLSKTFESSPYIWRWYAITFFVTKIEIKVIAYDNAGNSATDIIEIFKIY